MAKMRVFSAASKSRRYRCRSRRGDLVRACNSVTNMNQFAAPQRVRRNRQEIPCPSYFRVREDGDRLRISFVWFRGGFANAAFIWFFWTSFVVGWYWGALRTPEKRIMWFAIVWGVPFAAVGLLLFYAILAVLLN